MRLSVPEDGPDGQRLRYDGAVRTYLGAWLSCFALAACPAGAGGTDAGVDAGPSLSDAGPDGGCAADGYPCASTLPCCSASDVCNSILNICLPDAGSGTSGTTGGGTTGGSAGGTTGGLPGDGAQWLPETVAAPILGLTGLSVPSPRVQVAVGNALGFGQLLVRTVDGGWSPLPGSPGATSLSGVWADPAGDLFAVGASDAGAGLLLAGTLDGGLAAVDLDGGPPFDALLAVWGLGPGEAIAVGLPVSSVQMGALHLWPDGGLSAETLPPELSRVYRLARGDGGPLYALALSTSSGLPPWVLARADAGWTELPEVFAAVNLADLAVGPAGDVTLVGDDGNGHAQAFALVDGGFAALPLPPLPPLTAVYEPAPGTLYVATASPGQAGLLRLQDGGWQSEGLPTSAATINAISGDGPDDAFAVGLASPPSPLALHRSP